MSLAFVSQPVLILPPHEVELDTILADMEVRKAHHPRLGSLLRIVRNTQVQRRRFIEPFETVVQPRSYSERNTAAWTHLSNMGVRAAEAAVHHAGLGPADIDAVITSHSTGDAVPGLDVHLRNELRLSTNIRRIPMTQLGCVGGAHSMIRAVEQTILYPGSKVLVVLAEGLSSIYQAEVDTIEGNVFNALFGDSATAFIVSSEPLGPGLQIDLHGTWEGLIENSTDRYWKEVDERGIHFLSTKAATTAVAELAPELNKWLHEDGRWPIEFFVAHSGGPAILEHFSEALDVPEALLAHSWDSLRELGNIGGSSVIDVLRRTYTTPPKHGARGLLVGVGPGFSGAALRCTWQDGTPAAD